MNVYHIRTPRVQILTYFFFVVIFIIPHGGRAEVFQSSNFRVLDPVVSIGAEYSTSSNFILRQALGEPALGTSSATNFQIIAGFLPFPKVTLPVPTATAGDASANLSWSASSGFLGWTVSGYNVGYSLVSGGPYTYTTVGNVTNATVSGLSNGSVYYFIVRPQDFFLNSIGTSTQVSATPVASSASGGTTSGGGGGPPDLIKTPFIPISSPKTPIVTPTLIPPEVKIATCLARTDFNKDDSVNIVDLSIFLYYFPKPIREARGFDLNKDDVIDIVDVSIIFFCWNI